MKLTRCQCSRCNLYLRGSADSADPDYLAQAGIKSLCFEDRKYQTALIEYAKNHNIIGCLPTGSGKTFIALKLIEHFTEQIVAEKKKVFFLANTIPLVNQQAAFIARHTSMAVRHLTGDMGVDYWTEENWQAVLDAFNVMAMTSQIFLNLLRHGYIKLSQVALLIFDECHHATNDHPMKQIMKEYADTKNLFPTYPRPRILGLTATIIKGTCKPDEVSTKVTELESTMDSVALTYKDYEEVLKHSTSAKVTPVLVANILTNTWWFETSIVEDMTSLSKALQEFRKERKKAKHGVAKLNPTCLDPKLRTMDNVYNLMLKRAGPGDLKVAVDDVLHAYKELGVYCTMIAINLRLAFIEYSLMDVNDGKVKDWYLKVKKYFQELRIKMTAVMGRQSEADRVNVFVSPKLKKLIDILETYREHEEIKTCECPSADNRLCGIVFVDRRATAQVLAWYLKDLAESSKMKHGFIRASFVVGTSRTAFESMDSRVYSKNQTEIINGFRTKKYNILTATSVLEEGIDVPSCNLVVRFDPISTYTSYIQSMGRARKQGASFYALLSDKNYSKDLANLQTFKKINEKIIAHLQRNVEKIDVGDHTIAEVLESDLIPPICPGGTADSPKITMDSAHEIIDRYCMLLPCDGISSLQTLSWWVESFGGFQATLKIPLNGLVRENIVGPILKNKEHAKQGAYMVAAQKLLDAGAFDERLVPVHPSLSIKVQKFFTNFVSSLNDGDGVDDCNPGPSADTNNKAVAGKGDKTATSAGTSETATPKRDQEAEFQLYRKEWYQKRNPKVLHELPVLPNKSYFLYQIVFELVEEKESSAWKNLYKFDSSTEGFAILCSQELPDIGVFPLYGGFGAIHCLLKKLPSKTLKLNERTLENFKNLQFTLFGKVLGLENILLRDVKQPSFLIVPLCQDKLTGKWRFNDSEQHESLNLLQKTRPPKRNRSCSPKPCKISDDEKKRKLENIQKKFTGAIVVPWYKKPKPAYFVDSVADDMNPLSNFHDELHRNYKSFIFEQFKARIEDDTQPLLKCKLAGIAIGKSSKPPIQLNYLLEKYAKEDENPVYLVPELCYVATVSSSFIIQLKLLPSFIHRLSRLLLAQEVLSHLATEVDWSGAIKKNLELTSALDEKELQLLTTAQEYKRVKEEERRKLRKEMRDSKLTFKKVKLTEKPLIEQRELHYEFIHPSKITLEDIQLFHEAVSTQHSAKQLTLDSSDVEIVNAELSLTSRFKLEDFEELDIDPLEKAIDFSKDNGPSLLSIMEALTIKMSNDGVAYGRLQVIGSSFLNFAVSTFVYFNYPVYGEPLMCQFRNRLLSIQFLNAVASKREIGELLSGSDFHPNDTWLPPGSKVFADIGDVAAENKVHISVFNEIMKNGQLEKMKTREDAERFAAEKKKIVFENLKPEAMEVEDGEVTENPKKSPFIVHHATFTHCELADFDLVNGLYALVGSFFTNCGPLGAYKCLEWLGFKCPDVDGEGRLVNDLNRACVQDIQQSAIYSNGGDKMNHLIPDMEALEKLLGYRFKSKSLLLNAFTHPTYPAHNLTECYQRLEFIGDGVLDFLLTNYVYSLPKGFTPEELSDIRKALVNSVTYASLAVRYGFHKHLISMSKPLTDMIDNFVVHQESVEHFVVGHFTLVSDEECWGPQHIEVPKVLGDIWESVAGAIFVDSGKSLDAVWRVFYRLMQHEIDVFCESKPKAPIYELKMLMKKHDADLKFTRTTGKKMQARGREMVKVSVGPYGHYFGMGTSKARAKDAAAKIAVKMIKQEDVLSEKLNSNRNKDKIMLLHF